MSPCTKLAVLRLRSCAARVAATGVEHVAAELSGSVQRRQFGLRLTDIPWWRAFEFAYPPVGAVPIQNLIRCHAIQRTRVIPRCGRAHYCASTGRTVVTFRP